MGFVVDFHELTDGGMSVFLRRGEGLVAQQFLDSAKIGAVRQKMSGKSMAERMGMQVPIDVGEANVFLDDTSHGALREAASGVVEENGLKMGNLSLTGTVSSPLLQELFTERPVFFERGLCLLTVRNDALLVTFAADAEDPLFLIDVQKVQASQFADTEPRGVKKFEECAIAAKKKALFGSRRAHGFLVVGLRWVRG